MCTPERLPDFPGEDVDLAGAAVEGPRHKMAPVPAILTWAPGHIGKDLGHDVLMQTLLREAPTAQVVPPVLKSATHLVGARVRLRF